MPRREDVQDGSERPSVGRDVLYSARGGSGVVVAVVRD